MAVNKPPTFFRYSDQSSTAVHRFNLALPDELFQQAKKAAQDGMMPLTELVRRALINYLDSSVESRPVIPAMQTPVDNVQSFDENLEGMSFEEKKEFIARRIQELQGGRR